MMQGQKNIKLSISLFMGVSDIWPIRSPVLICYKTPYVNYYPPKNTHPTLLLRFLHKSFIPLPLFKFFL